MTDLNRVELIGRITRDSVLEKTSETVYAKFSIAVNKDVKTENGNYESVAEYFDLAIFNNYAEKTYKFLRKGTLVLVEGSVKPRTWNKDDVKINTIGITVKKIRLLSSPKTASTNTNTGTEQSEKVYEENSTDNTQQVSTDSYSYGNDFSNSENIEPSDSELTGIF